jgi:integrase
MARIIRYPKPKRRQTAALALVSQEEMAQLFTALAAEPLQSQVFFLLCAVAGASYREAASLQWANLDLNAGTWTCGGSAPGSMLPSIARTRLARLPQIGEAVFHAERYGGATWAPGGAHLYWGRIYDRARLPTIKIEAIRFTWKEWERTNDPVMGWLDEMLDRMTNDQLHNHVPPPPSVGVRAVALSNRRILPIRHVVQSRPVALDPGAATNPS